MHKQSYTSLAAFSAILLLAACNDSAGNGGGSTGSGDVTTTGFAKAEALNYTTTYDGETDWAAPDEESELTTLANSAFLLWNLQQVQRGIDDLVGIKTLAPIDDAFDEEQLPWDSGFNGAKCAPQAGTYSITSGSVTTASGTAELVDFCYVDADLTDHSDFVVNGSISWSNAELDSSTGYLGYFVEFSDLAVTWRGENWMLNGASETFTDSTERAFSLDATRVDTGEVFRIQRVIRIEADTQFSERIFHPADGKLTLRSTQQDIFALTDGWADFGGVCDSDAYLSAEPNQAEFTVQVAQKGTNPTCQQYNLDGTYASGDPIQGGTFDLLAD